MPKNRKRNRAGFFESSNSKQAAAEEKPAEQHLVYPSSWCDFITPAMGPNAKKLPETTMPPGLVEAVLAMPERPYTGKINEGSEPFAVDLESIRPR